MMSKTDNYVKVEELVKRAIRYDIHGYKTAKVILLNDVLQMQTSEMRPIVNGEWLPTNDYNKKRCSECDVITLIAQYPFGKANYCPNCGAKMESKDNKEIDKDEIKSYLADLIAEMSKLGATDNETSLITEYTVRNAIGNKRDPKDLAWALMQ